MNSFTFVTLALALVAAVSAQSVEDLPHNDFYTETGVCIPHQTFVDKCNQCTCGPDGKKAICTLKVCQIPEKPRIDGFQAEGLSCPPGTEFVDGCRGCTCGPTGKIARCTPTADCNVHARSRRSADDDKHLRIDNFHETKTCPAGKSFKVECNTCVCAADGKNAACTLMACLDFQ